MAVLLPYWIVPALFLLGCLLAMLRKQGFWRRAGVYGLLAYFSSLAVGTLAILESRSSTSGIGFIFLPLLALAPGLLGFASGAFHHRHRAAGSSRATVALGGMVLTALGVMGILAYQAYGWLETSRLNEARDIEVQRQREAIRANTRLLAERLLESPGAEGRVIEEMASQTDDRTMLIPLAQHPDAPARVLDRLSRSGDFGVALSALRNESVLPESIVWVYRNHSYPDYFFSTIARNPNTPDWLLLELFGERQRNRGIAPGLAGNPRAPPSLLDELISLPEPLVQRDLAGNPALSCDQLRRLRAVLGRGEPSSRKERLTAQVDERLDSCTNPK